MFVSQSGHVLFSAPASSNLFNLGVDVQSNKGNSSTLTQLLTGTLNHQIKKSKHNGQNVQKIVYQSLITFPLCVKAEYIFENVGQLERVGSLVMTHDKTQ